MSSMWEPKKGGGLERSTAVEMDCVPCEEERIVAMNCRMKHTISQDRVCNIVQELNSAADVCVLSLFMHHTGIRHHAGKQRRTVEPESL